MGDTEKNSSESLDLTKLEKPKKPNIEPRWVKGISGNPKGRRKGSRNKVTILREAVLQKAENLVLDQWVELVQTTIDLAKKGDSTCIKILWDRVIPAKRAVEEKDGKEDKLNINITIKGMEVESTFGEKETPIDADYEEVK